MHAPHLLLELLVTILQLLHRAGELADRCLEPIEARLDKLFLTTLNRKPSAQEREKFAAFLADEKASVADAIWTLITGSEFRFNH